MKTKSPPRPARSAPRKPPSRPAKTSAGIAAKLIRIGNSRGVRLPKAVIEQAGLTGNVSISVNGNAIVIRAAKESEPRAGWEEQIKKALAEHGDDIDEWRDWQNMPNEFDEKEWTW